MTFLYTAYSITMTILFGYIFYLGKKQSKVIEEIESLKELYK